MPKTLPTPAAPAQDVTRGVLAIKPFRKLWNSMVFSSLGDWLGLLATTAMAQQLSGGDYATANFAIAGVFIARLLPAVFLGPLAGVIADKLDRRKLMVNCDILRAALYISIPIANNYFWLYTAMILVECITLFWSPAKDASVPNLVPREKLENANQVSLLAAYGTAPIAALLFTFLSLFTSAINVAFGINSTAVNLSLYVNALSFAFAAFTIWGLKEIPKGAAAKHAADTGILKSLHEGWKSVSGSKLIRGLIVGMVGAFVAAGAVIGLARTFVGDLGGGEAAYGVLFGAVFTGLAAGTPNKLLYVSPTDGGAPVVAPVVGLKSVTNITHQSADVNIDVNPGYAPTTLSFEYLIKEIKEIANNSGVIQVVAFSSYVEINKERNNAINSLRKFIVNLTGDKVFIYRKHNPFITW